MPTPPRPKLRRRLLAAGALLLLPFAWSPHFAAHADVAVRSATPVPAQALPSGPPQNSAPPASGSPSGPLASAAAVRWWNRIRGDFLGAFRTGECTDWAARMRPDIIAAVEEHAYSTWSAHPRGTPRAVTQWQAHNWVNYATWAGLPTGHRPRVGAVLVLQPHVLGAGPVGHVAYVVHVAPNGAFTVSGMRQPLAGRVTDWKLPASAARRRGVSFIYRGR